MVDTKRIVETKFVTVDQTTAKLNKMHGAATRVNSIFDKASATIVRYGGVAAAAAGAFSVGTAIIGAQRYLRTVRDISAATGFAASNVDAVLEVMDRANISADEGSQIIQKMGIAQQRYRMEVAKTGKAQSDASMIIQRLGINIDKGPQTAMVQLAKAAKQGKLSMADLVIAFQVSETGAIRLQSLLQRGPQVVGRIMENLQKSGLAINAQNIAAFNRYEEATIRIRSAWNRVSLVVSTKVMPVISGLLETVLRNIDDWTKHAEVWGETVSRFLHNHLDTVITIGKVMAANYALQRLTGVGIVGTAGGLFEQIRGGGGAATAAVQGADIAAGLTQVIKPQRVLIAALGPVAMSQFEMIQGRGGMAGLPGFPKQKGAPILPGAWGLPPPPKPGFFGRVLAPVKRVFAAVATRFPKTFGILTKAMPMLLRVGSVLLRLSAVGIAITVVVGLVMAAVQGIKDNAMGIRDVILGFWAQFQARFAVMWDVIRPLFSAIGKAFSKDGIIGNFFLVVLGTVITSLGTTVDGILRIMQTIMLAVSDILSSPSKLLSPVALVGAFSDAWLEAGRLTKLKRKELAIPEIPEARIPGLGGPPGARPPPPVFDFRNSKFDIKQMFAEGFDPDRIAVAFSNDLASLGERRLQSGLAPLFAIR